MRFYTSDGTTLDGPREWEPAVLDLELNPDQWEAAEFSINGLLLPLYVARRFGESRVLADWPRSGPGAYRLRVQNSDSTDERVVTVESAKLGRAGFAALLDDLERRLPTSIAIGLQRAGGLVGLQVLAPNEHTIAQEVLRLSRAIRGTAGRPGLVRVIPEIAVEPHHTLAREEVWVQSELARRVSVSALVHTLTRPGNLDAMHRPERVLDSRAHRTVDVYENRLLKAFIQEVRGCLARLERTAELFESPPLAAIRSLRISLQDAVRRAPFLEEVSLPAHALDRLTMVLLRDRRYRVLLDRFQEFHRSLWVTLQDVRLDAPLENVPSLYQSWGTLQVIDALLDVGSELGFEIVQQRIVRRRPGSAFVQVLPDGRSALQLRQPMSGVTVTLTPERSFGARGPLRSVSFLQRPDVVIEVQAPGGRSDLVLFDPKYKLDADDEGSGLPVKTDVDKMHSYRDAIRDQDGRHVVRLAATLYPGQTRHYGPGVAALGAAPGAGGLLPETLRELLRQHLARAGAGEQGT